MTVFCDDFNKHGPLDELKWNVAYSQCNDPLVSAAFVTQDLHAVTVGGTESFLHEGVGTFCDRLQVVARPRAIFDFTNREGVIAFDFDGSFGLRESWYVDVLPADTPMDVHDINSHVTFGPGAGSPARFLRVS